jgi:hypothetical protein
VDAAIAGEVRVPLGEPLEVAEEQRQQPLRGAVEALEVGLPAPLAPRC